MATRTCTIIHVGADSATEKHVHLGDAVMASQLIGDSAAFDRNSFVRGYHVYCQQWTTTVGDVLSLKQEPNNCRDRFTVAVMKNIVGHVPKERT